MNARKFLFLSLLAAPLASAQITRSVDDLPALLGSAVAADDFSIVRDASVNAPLPSLRQVKLSEYVDIPGFFGSVSKTELQYLDGVTSAVQTQLDAKAGGTVGAVGRYAGYLENCPPITGTYLAGDWVHDTNGNRWVCTTAGTPGIWRTTNVLDPRATGAMIAGYDINHTTRTGSDIDSWIDISGNGRHATADGTKSIVYGTPPNEYTGGYPNGHYTPASAIPVTPTGMTVIGIYGGRRMPSGYQPYYAVASMNNDNTLGFLATFGMVQFYNPTRQIGICFETGWMNSFAARWGVGETSYTTNGVKFTGAANGAATTAIAKIWGYAGPGGFGWCQERIALLFFNRTLSDYEIAGIERFYGVRPATRSLHLIADSFGNWGATSQQVAYPHLVEIATGGSLVGLASQSGQVTGGVDLPSMAQAVTNAVAAGLNPVVIYDLGKNDAASGVAAATTKANITAHLAGLKAAGADVLVLTLPPRSTGFSGGVNAGTYETARISDLNPYIRTECSTNGYFLVDIAAHPGFDDAADAGGANFTDGIHLSNTGQVFYADLIVDEIPAP